MDSFKDDIKPFIKWAGGKSWLVPILMPMWLKHKDKRLVEPFCGALNIVLRLNPRNALLNDQNKHLINLFTHVRDGLEIALRVQNSEEYYYTRRDEFNKLIELDKHDTARSAMLYYYLLKAGYNGLSRFNNSGRFNTPRGDYKQVKLSRSFPEHQRLFKKWKFRTGDFATIKLRKNDFVYIDPPYHKTFTKYDGVAFTWDDQVRLANWAAKHNGPVIISNSKHDEIAQLYEEAGFTVSYVSAPRSLNSKSDGRGRVEEILAYKNV